MFARMPAFLFGFAEHHTGAANTIEQGSDLAPKLQQVLVFHSLAYRVIPVSLCCLPCGFQLSESIFESGTGADEIKAFHEQLPVGQTIG